MAEQKNKENIIENNDESSNSLFEESNLVKRKSTYNQQDLEEELDQQQDKAKIEEEKKKEELRKKHANQLTMNEKKDLLKKRKISGFVQGCDSVECYEKLNKIHEGVYGVVYRARDKLSNKIVAIKKSKIDRQKEKEGFPITSIREFNILLSISHPNIVGTQRVVIGPDLDKIFMIMEYCEHELRDLLEGKKYQFTEAEIKSLMYQLLDAMKYLHKRDILHRDLKSSNILYNNQGVLKVCDFGLGRKYIGDNTKYTPIVVTLWYRAPELLLGNEQYTKAIDMWSVGCIFAELLLKDPLFKGQGETEQLKLIFQMLGTPTEYSWKGWTNPAVYKHAKIYANLPRFDGNHLKEKIGASLKEEGYDLLNKMLCMDPSQRITAEKALQHPWFKKFPPPQSQELMPTFKDSNDIERNLSKKIKKDQK